MLGLYVFFFIAGSWLALHLPVMPSVTLMQACVFYMGQSSVYACCYPKIQRVIWCLCFIGFGFLLSVDAVLNWHMRQSTLLPQNKIVLRCGQLVQPLRMSLPSQRWLFRLSSYSFLSSLHRYDQFILHAYSDDAFHESDYVCVLLKPTRSRAYKPWDSLRFITQGVVGHAQLKEVLFHHSLIQSADQSIRYGIRRWVWHFSSEQVQHFLLALSIGDRSGMTKEDWALFSKTGTSHLVAISGLHVMWVVLGFGSLVMGAFNFLSKSYELIPRGVVYAVLIVFLCVLYGVIIYPSPPSERALLLLMLSAGCRLFGIRYASSNMLWFVLLLSCFLYPFFIFQASACLSYWAAYCLWQSSWLGRDDSCRSWVLLQVWMLLGLMPLSLYYFGKWYGLSLIANLWVVPWVGLLIFPVSLISYVVFIAIPSCSHYPIAVAQSFVEGMFHCLSLLSHYSFLGFKVLGFDSLQCVLCFGMLYSVRIIVSTRYMLGVLFPMILLLCFGWQLPGRVVMESHHGVGCKQIRTIHSKDLSVLQIQDQPRSFYRFSLPQYRSHFHWEHFASCSSSDRYAVFPSGLCGSVRLVRYRHYRGDVCSKPAKWVYFSSFKSRNPLIYIPQGVMETLL